MKALTLRVTGRWALRLFLAMACGCALAQSRDADLVPGASFLTYVSGREAASGKTIRAGTLLPTPGPSSWTTGFHPAVVRVDPEGLLDPTFGEGGVAYLPQWGQGGTAIAVKALADGSIVVGVDLIDAVWNGVCASYDFCVHFIGIVRLLPDGRLDTAFNGTGQVIFHLGEVDPLAEESYSPKALNTLAVQDDGTILVYGNPNVTPGALVARVDPSGAAVVALGLLPVHIVHHVSVSEFYHRVLDRYFMTSDPREVRALEFGEMRGWQRTGNAFHAMPGGTEVDDLAPVCRFYGLPQDGLDSHLFTLDTTECAALGANPSWRVESEDAFRTMRPEPATGACPANAVPVYRLWDPRERHAHRLTTSTGERGRALAIGWLAEGYGPEGVAMCALP